MKERENMNETILPDDPRLTAYALGELHGDERALIEAAVRRDPILQKVLEETRAMVAQLEVALTSELTAAQEDASSSGLNHEPIKRETDTTRRYQTSRGSKLLRLPQSYFIIGGLAAACFALVVVLNEPPKSAEKKVYREIDLAPAPVVNAANQAQQPMAAETPTTVAADLSLLAQAKDRLASEQRARVALPWTEKALKFAASSSSPPLISAGAKAERNKSSDRANRAGIEMAAFKLTNPPRQALLASANRFVGLSTTFGGASAHLGEAQTERYRYQQESDFLSAWDHPLSTFSADVDTASYANVRRFIQSGRRPPIDAVRIEELVNYFPYRYAPPAGNAPFAATIEAAEAPWAPEHRLVRIGLKGREIGNAQRGAASLVFLLDVSGSMNAPNKLPLVKESMRLLLQRLRPDDRVAIVTYAGATGLVLPSTPVAKLREIAAAIENLRPEGSTNGAMGIQLAYDIAKANFVAGGVNRVVLCTDGDFNVGTTSEGELVRLVADKAQSGVFLTVLGFGRGNLNDSMLQQIADRANGSYGYIDTRREAEKLLVEQVSGTLVTIAKDVKLQVEFNPAKVARYRLIGYEKRLLKNEDFNNDTVDAGEIGAGHTVTALYEIVPVGSEPASQTDGEDALKYRRPNTRATELQNAASDELLTLKIRYKEPDGAVSKKLEFPLVDRGATFADASDDFKFAAAVASFGMLLRDSPHKGAATFASVVSWAEAGSGADAGGYRAEFVGLVRQAESLQ